ncbi:MAG: acyl-CoA dehydrogenase family protein, partial [Sphingorhabdus sp.]
MTDIATYSAKARAWLTSVAAIYGRDAQAGMDEEQRLALGRRYLKERFNAGYAGINWPVDMGGQGLTHIEKVAYETEEMAFGMPVSFFGISLGMPVPMIMRYCEDKAWVKE